MISPRASRLITSLDPDTYADHASEIIEAINKTAKPYFGDVELMTYAQWVERFVELAYPFTDPTWDDRFFDLLHRVEARLNPVDHGEVETLFPEIADIADAPAAVDKLLAAYPQPATSPCNPATPPGSSRSTVNTTNPCPGCPSSTATSNGGLAWTPCGKPMMTVTRHAQCGSFLAPSPSAALPR